MTYRMLVHRELGRVANGIARSYAYCDVALRAIGLTGASADSAHRLRALRFDYNSRGTLTDTKS